MSIDRTVAGKEQKERRRNRRDIAANRLALLFALAVIGISAVFIIKGNFELRLAMHGGAASLIAALALIAAGIAVGITAFARRRRGIKTPAAVFSLSFLSGLLLAVGLFLLLYRTATSETVAVVCVIVALALSFVYYIYSREFFILSLLFAAAFFFIDITGIISIPGISAALETAALVCGLALSAAVFALLIILAVRGGTAFGGRISTPERFRAYPFYSAAALMAAGSVLGYFFGLVKESIIALAAVYFVFALIYTIDMTK